MEKATRAKVVACGGIGVRTCTESYSEHFQVMALGFLFFTPKGQEPSSHFIHLRRFYWLAFRSYMSLTRTKSTRRRTYYSAHPRLMQLSLSPASSKEAGFPISITGSGYSHKI